MQARNKHHSVKSFQENASWTNKDGLYGWKHFRIVGRRYDAEKQLEIELMSICDKAVRFWRPSSELKKSDSWHEGWL